MSYVGVTDVVKHLFDHIDKTLGKNSAMDVLLLGTYCNDDVECQY